MHRILFALSLALALGLVACSGNDDDGSPTPLASSGATAVRTSTVVPTAVSTKPPPIDGTVAPQNPGSLDPVTIKANPDPPRQVAILKDVRVGAHPENGGWDRIVFEFASDLPPGSVRYVTESFSCGKGDATKVLGTAMLRVQFTTAQAHTDAGESTVKSRRILGPGNVILESVEICDFEADVTWIVGVKERKPFKVTTLTNPTRVVIDVKQ